MTAREFKQYESWKAEAQRLRLENQELRLELHACEPELYQAYRKIERLEQQLQKLRGENRRLKEQLPAAPGPFFPGPQHPRHRGRPGREAGHAAALRPRPSHINQHLEVPLPRDAQGRFCCPRHHIPLMHVQRHRRLVEDIVPAHVVATCYHTVSGYCSQCREYVESRHPQQPPAAEVPQGLLGLNTLVLAAQLRVEQRLPYAQIAGVLQEFAGLKVCRGALARQMQRMGRWLGGDYARLQRRVRGSAVVGADETGWSVNGKRQWIWTLCTEKETFYHADKSRGGKVIRGLLGKHFGGWLVSDFLSAYDQASSRQQRCLTHLARELDQTAEEHREFAAGGWYRRCRRLLKDMNRLKRRRRRFGSGQYEHRVQLIERRLRRLWQEPGGDGQVRRLQKRLRRYEHNLTPFLRVRKLPGNNNTTEREIRPLAVLRKISGGSRSPAGARATAVVASLVRTAVRQGKNVGRTLRQLLRRAWAGRHRPSPACSRAPPSDESPTNLHR